MREKSIAYIDASNLKFGTLQNGWKLNHRHFKSWLRDKFNAQRAILFMGLVPEHFDLYNFLQGIGYEIVFKPTLVNKEGKTKGNVPIVILDDFRNKLSL